MTVKSGRLPFAWHSLTSERVVVVTATTLAVILVVELLAVHRAAHTDAATRSEAGCTCALGQPAG